MNISLFSHPNANAKRSPSFVHIYFYDVRCQNQVLQQLAFSTTPAHFEQRLLLSGYDLAPALPRDAGPSTSVRCWRLLLAGTRDHVGALWDAPGHMGSLASAHPSAAPHPLATMCLYLPETDPLYVRSHSLTSFLFTARLLVIVSHNKILNSCRLRFTR